MTQRYAIYFCPEPNSELFAFGRSWLGRDPATAGPEITPDCGLASDQWLGLTRDARRYGFHGTLKPPFTLKEGRSRAKLVEAIGEIASTSPAFDMAPLQLMTIDRFIALALKSQPIELTRLAARCVTALDPFRASASAEELTKRRRAGLSPRQDELLERFGYPYVLDEFRFHMTLTDRLDEAWAEPMLALLRELSESARAEWVRVADLTLFEEREPGAPFVLVERFPLNP